MKQISKTRQRAALDRILTAILTEEDAGSIQDVIAWLSYAVCRDEARIVAEEDDAEDLNVMTPAVMVENQFEAMLDDPKDEVREQFGLIDNLASRLDPGYNEPILQQANWLSGDMS